MAENNLLSSFNASLETAQAPLAAGQGAAGQDSGAGFAAPANLLAGFNEEISAYRGYDRLDPDPLGTKTEREGRRLGTGWTKDTVLSVNLYDQEVSAETILGLDGGKELLDTVSRNRTGRRGFMESLTTGAPTDFIPYLGDLASLGISVRNMSKARDAMNKMRDEGPGALSIQEKVLLKLYEEDSIRQSKQSWGGLVGSIMRQAPAFAGEFLTTGAGFRLASTAFKKGAKELAEDTALSYIRQEVKGQLKKRTAVAAAGAAAADKTAWQALAKETALKFSKGADTEVLERSLLRAAQDQADAVLNPKFFQGKIDFFAEYAKRGLFNHGDDMFIGSAPGVANRLREAAGVMFVEAPIKGALYGAFDFWGVNPVAARLLGADEAVTRNELMFASSQDPEIAANAKMLAFGTAVAEYASESSGRGFNALGGLVKDVAGAPMHRLAGGALAAVRDTAAKQGSYVGNLMAKAAGFKTLDEAKTQILKVKTQAAKRAAGKLGLTAEAVRADPKLINDAVREFQAQQEKSFFGFWLADKMVNKGWTPDTAGKWLRNAGYDEVLGEFMEERYNGFAQGVFGLDGQSDSEEKNIVLDRLARGAKNFFPPTWGQATAEIVAFAMPMAGRAVINQGFAALGAGAENATRDLATALGEYAGRGGMIIEGESGAEKSPIPDNWGIVSSDGGTKVSLVEINKNTDPKPIAEFTAEEAREYTAAQGMPNKERRDTQQRLRAQVAMRAMPGGGVTEGGTKFVPAARTQEEADTPEAKARKALGRTEGRVSTALTLDEMADLAVEVGRAADTMQADRVGVGQKIAGVALGLVNLALTGNPMLMFNNPTAEIARERLGAAGGAMLMGNLAAHHNALYTAEIARRKRAEAASAKAGAKADAGMLSVDPEDIEAAIRPAYREAARRTLKGYLYSRGTNMVEDRDIKDLVANIRKENDGKLPEGYESDEAFTKKFRDKLSEVVRGRMTVQFLGDQAAWSVQRPDDETGADMFEHIDRFLAPLGMQSYLRLTDVTDPDTVLKHTAGIELDVDMVQAVANIQDIDNASAEEYKALNALVYAWIPNPNFMRNAGLKKAFAEVQDRARVILATQSRLLLPYYGAEGAAAEQAAFNGEVYTHPSIPGKTFTDLGQLASAAEGLGLQTRRATKILMTSYNQYFTEKPAQFAYFFRDYMKGGAHELNPYRTEGDWASAEALDQELRAKAAAGDMVSKERVEAYDAAMAESLAASRIREVPDPADPSRKGWMVTPSATTDRAGTTIRIPLKHFASSAGIIEDSTEGAVKKNPGAFAVARTNSEGKLELVYRPAAKDFIQDVRTLLNNLETDLDKLPEKTASDIELVKQARMLQKIFDPGAYNIEAISKSIAAFRFYQGDNAINGIGGRMTEAALYTALGRIAKEARGLNSFAGFDSLTSRLFGSGMLVPGAKGLRKTMYDVVPKTFIDGTDKAVAAGKPPVNALDQVETNAAILKAEIETAGKILKADAALKAAYDAHNAQEAFLPEDMPAVVRELQSLMQGGVVQPAENPPEVLVVVSEEETGDIYAAPKPTADEEDRGSVDPENKGDSNAVAESCADPAQAVLMAAYARVSRSRPELMALFGISPDTGVAMPGDDDYLNKAFGFWKAVSPGMRDSDIVGFRDALAKATGVRFRVPGEEGPAQSKVRAEPAAAEGENVDDNEVQTPETNPEEKVDDGTPGSFIHFNDDGMRAAYARFPSLKALRTLIELFDPKNAGSTVGFRRSLVQDSRDAGGDLAALMSDAYTETLHPALQSKESFDAWISGPHKETSPRSLMFLAALEAMGFEEAFKAIAQLRGATAMAGLRLKATGQIDFSESSEPANVVDSLALFARGRTPEQRKAAEKELDAWLVKAKKEAFALPKYSTNPFARRMEVAKRMNDIADKAESVFGRGNIISESFRDPAAHIRVARYGLGSPFKAAQPDAWLTSVASPGSGLPYAGLLYQRLTEAAGILARTGDGARAAAALFQDSLKTKNPSVRGSFRMMLNLAAGAKPVEQARTLDGKAKVALVAPSKSETMNRMLQSARFERIAWAYHGVFSQAAYTSVDADTQARIDADVANLREFAVWPDGTPVFASVLGVDYGEKGKAGSVFPVRINKVLRTAYEANPDGYIAVQLYGGDKSKPLVVTVPGSLPGIAIKGHLVLDAKNAQTAGYDDVARGLARIAGIDTFKNKRVGAITLNYGLTLPLAGTTRFVMPLPARNASAEMLEASYGEMMVTGEGLTGSMRNLAGNQGLLAGKYHVTQSDNGESNMDPSGESLFAKGVQHIVGEDDLGDTRLSETRRNLISLFLKEAEGRSSAVLLDGDVAKEVLINSENAGVFADGKIMPLGKWLLANREATGETEVTWMMPRWKEPRTVKISDVLPGFEIRRDVDIGGRPTDVISYDAKARFQLAANLHHSATPEKAEVASNIGREVPEAVGFLALGNELTQAYHAAHPNTEPVNLRDPMLKTAIDRGAVRPESDFAAQGTASALASRANAKVLLSNRVLALNRGEYDRARTEGGALKFSEDGSKLVLENPYGAPSPLAHGELVTAKDRNGNRTLIPASVACNIRDPFFRYGMYVNEGHEAFSEAGGDQRRIAGVVRGRLQLLDSFRRSHNTQGYIEYLADQIMPLFTDLEGKPFAKGRVFSFDDLFILSAKGERVFDETALYHGKRAPGDKSRVFLNGGSAVLVRTPSGNDGSAWTLARVYDRATKSGPTTERTALASINDKGRWAVGFEGAETEDAASDEAILTDNAQITTKSGNDHDGDEMNVLVYGFSPDGIIWHYADESHITEETKNRWRDEITDPDSKKAARNFAAVMTVLGNSVRAQQEKWLRFRDRNDRVEGPAAPANAEADNIGFNGSRPVGAVPYSDEAKQKLDAEFPPEKPDKSGADGAAALTEQGIKTAMARGNAVHAVGIMHYVSKIFDLRADGAFGRGQPVLFKADGTPFERFTADFSKPLTEEQWGWVNRFADKWSNAFFDSLKGDGSAVRYGMDRNLVALHFMFLVSARPTSQAEYDAFGLDWARWANGPVGKAIVARAEALNDPGYDGESGIDVVDTYGDTSDLEASLAEAIPEYSQLDFNDAQSVLAAAVVYSNSGDSIETAIEKVAGLAEVLRFVELSRAVLRTNEAEHGDFATVESVDRFDKRVKEAAGLLAKGSRITIGKNARLLKQRVIQAYRLIPRLYSAFDGTYETSGLCRYAARRLSDNGKATPATLRAARAMREKVAASVYASAASALTPASVGEKLAAMRKNGSAGFLSSVEEAYRRLFAAYAADKQLAGTIPLFTMLVVPYKDEATNDVPAIMPAAMGDAESSLPALESGLAALRDWSPENKALDITLDDGTVLTPADMWHALRIYATMTAPVSYKMTRGGKSWISAFGTEVMKAYTGYQILAYRKAGYAAPVFEIANAPFETLRRNVEVPASMSSFGAVTYESIDAEVSELVSTGVAQAPAAEVATAAAEKAAAQETAVPEPPKPAKEQAPIQAAEIQPGVSAAVVSAVEAAEETEALKATQALATLMKAKGNMFLASYLGSPVWEISPANEAAASRVAALFETGVKAPGVAGTRAEKIFTTAAKLVRALGPDIGVIRGGLLAARDVLAMEGTTGTPEAAATAAALAESVNLAGTDADRLTRIETYREQIYNSGRFSAAEQILMYATAFPASAGTLRFKAIKDGGPKPSDAAARVIEKLGMSFSLGETMRYSQEDNEKADAQAEKQMAARDLDDQPTPGTPLYIKQRAEYVALEKELAEINKLLGAAEETLRNTPVKSRIHSSAIDEASNLRTRRDKVLEVMSRYAPSVANPESAPVAESAVSNAVGEGGGPLRGSQEAQEEADAQAEKMMAARDRNMKPRPTPLFREVYLSKGPYKYLDHDKENLARIQRADNARILRADNGGRGAGEVRPATTSPASAARRLIEAAHSEARRVMEAHNYATRDNYHTYLRGVPPGTFELTFTAWKKAIIEVAKAGPWPDTDMSAAKVGPWRGTDMSAAGGEIPGYGNERDLNPVQAPDAEFYGSEYQELSDGGFVSYSGNPADGLEVAPEPNEGSGADDVVKAAVGFTPDRGNGGKDRRVAELLARIEEREAEIDWTDQAGPQTDAQIAAAQAGENRKVLRLPSAAGFEAMAEAAAMMISENPGLAVAAYGDHLSAVLDALLAGTDFGGFGRRAADELRSAAFTEAGVLRWYGGKASEYRKAMVRLGNVQANLVASIEAEEAKSGRDASAPLTELRGNVNKAFALARSWIAASHADEFAEQRVALQAVSAGHPLPEVRLTPAKLAKALGTYRPIGNGELDPETLSENPWDNFKVIFADSDIFFAGAVMPFFRGQGIRDILLDKTALAALPTMFATSNFLTNLYAAGNDKGTILKMIKVDAASWKADGKGGYEYAGDERGKVNKFQRGSAYRDVTNDAFTPEEFALARFMLAAVHAYVGDGGDGAKIPLSGQITFADLPKGGSTDISYEAAVERLNSLKTNENGIRERPWSVDILMANAHNNVPAEVFARVEKEIQEAYKLFASASGSASERDAIAIDYLHRNGFANRRLKTGPGGQTSIVSTVLTVPARYVEEVFKAGTAHAKLLASGREAGDLTLAKGAALVREAFKNARNTAGANMGWMLGDLSRMHGAGENNPFFRGTGFYSYLARQAERPPLPEYSDKMRELYNELRDTAGSCFDKEGNARPVKDALKFAPRMVKFYADLFVADSALAGNLESVVAELAKQGGRYSLGGNATMWDLAQKIYAESAKRIHETAARGGGVADLVLGDVPLHVFNAAIDATAEARDIENRREGLTWSEIYELDGALPRNLGADEAVAIHAQELSTAVRYRCAINQALLAADEKGMPLVYADPGENADDTVPERMWAQIARWWAESNEMGYDESKTGRENAKAIFAAVSRDKITMSGEAVPEGAVRKYVFRNVELPPGMGSFTRMVAAVDAPGNEAAGMLTTWTGGEAYNVMKQILAVPGYGHRGAMLAGINRTLSWSKSLSVMASVFFPIATAFESPIAAVGFAPTVFGLTKTGSDLARKLTAGDGPLAAALKRGGVDRNAPFMADIMRLIGSDDPALTELKTHAILSGLSLADRSKNMTDHDRQVLAQDIRRLSELAASVRGAKAGRAVRILLEGALEESSELAFEYVINATKLAVFAQMNNRFRAEAAKAGRWWDPVREMRKWAPYINAEVGGIDPAMYPWATPQALQIMKTMMFSWEWTLGAWEAGGGGVLTRMLFGAGTNPQTRRFMFGRWWRMATGVMIGLPVAFQVLMTAVGAAAGDDDETKDDKWFNWQNEKGRELKDFDITPMLRAMAKAPLLPGVSVKDFKRAHPLLGNFIPGLSGDEGDMTSSRKRRYYMHFGKQGWEVAGWFQDPMKSMLGKLSMPVQRTLEGVFGIQPSMGWEKPFKDLGFWERWTSLDPEKSALVNLAGAFVPFSFSGVYRNPEAGFLNAVGPIGKGMSKTRAEKEMAAMFSEWADNDSFAGLLAARPHAWTELHQMGAAWSEALRLNGYDPRESLKNAVAAARKPLYERVHKAIPAFPGTDPDKEALEEAARGLKRLDFIYGDLRKSIRARDKRQNINRDGELGKLTDEVLRDAFFPPKANRDGDERLKRSADRGGDVSAFLSSDEVPKTVLGYRVLRTEELSADDLKFFEDNPGSAGHFDLEGGAG